MENQEIKKPSLRRKCPSCGKETRSLGAFCPTCGKPMDPQDPFYATTDSTNQVPSDQEKEETADMAKETKKKRCTKCGFVMATTMSYCGHCGSNNLEIIEGPVKPDPAPKPPVPPTPTPEPIKNDEEDEPMKETTTKKINPWWLLAILAVVILAILAYGYLDEQNDRLAAQSEKITALEAAQTNTTPDTTYVYVPSTVDTDTTDGYDWGWDKEEYKILMPGYVCAGDVSVEGIKYFDEGGVNEATLVINQSSRGLATFAEWGAGELRFADKGNSETQLVRDEFDNGGDPDARTVRVVIISDSKITQTWYRYKNGIITDTKTLVSDR